MTGFDFDNAFKSAKSVYLVEFDLLHDIQRKGKAPLEVLKTLMQYGAILDTAFDLASAGTSTRILQRNCVSDVPVCHLSRNRSHRLRCGSAGRPDLEIRPQPAPHARHRLRHHRDNHTADTR